MTATVVMGAYAGLGYAREVKLPQRSPSAGHMFIQLLTLFLPLFKLIWDCESLNVNLK